MINSNLSLIFDEWKANLKSRDRSSNAVTGNFDELFETLKRSNATFEEAHAILPRAIKAHLPHPAVAKTIYKNSKSNPKVAHYTEKEFVDQWNQDIADKGTASFFDVFPRPKIDADEDGEPKIFGQMSAKEYRAQRRYAEQFPRINTEALERALVSNTYNPAEDYQNILGEDDGDSK